MKKDKRLKRIKERLKNDPKNNKKIGVAIRTSSGLAYGWIDEDYATETDKLWWNTPEKRKFTGWWSE